MPSKEYLRQIVSKETNDIIENHHKYRCHEAARFIGKKLNSLGINANIKDGLATYKTDFILKQSLYSPEHLLDGVNKDAEEDFWLEIHNNLKKRVTFFHSWLEVPEKQTGDTTVVDLHFNMNLSKNVSVGDLLIVEDKKDLKGEVFYRPIGVKKGDFIVFKVFLPKVTRLRM